MTVFRLESGKGLQLVLTGDSVLPPLCEWLKANWPDCADQLTQLLNVYHEDGENRPVVVVPILAGLGLISLGKALDLLRGILPDAEAVDVKEHPLYMESTHFT